MNAVMRKFGGQKWSGPALLFSLVLNLFLIGLFVGPMLLHDGHPGGRRGFGAPSPIIGMLERHTRSLPKDDRDALRAIMVEQFPNIRPYFAKISEARIALADAMASTPYDEEKVRTAFANLDKVFDGMTTLVNESVVTGLARLPEDQRARIAQAMRENMWRRGGPNKEDRDRVDNGPDAPPPPPPPSDD